MIKLSTSIVLFAVIVFYPILGASQQPENPNWTEPEIVSGNLPGGSLYPHLFARKGGGALLVWAQSLMENTSNPDEIFFREFDGSQWSAIQNISNSSTPSRTPLVLSDHQGVIHAFWLEKLNTLLPPQSPRFSDIFYSYRKGNIWTEPKSIYHTDIIAGVGGLDVMIDHKDHLHVSWISPESRKFLYTRTDKWKGKNHHWNAPRELFAGGMADMTMDNMNKLHVVFAHHVWPEPDNVLPKPNSTLWVNDLFYSYSVNGGQSWADRILVHNSGTQPALWPEIVVDRTQKIHIIWLKDYDSDPYPDDILHSFSTDGYTWSEPVSITRLTTGDFFSPAIAVDPNNCIHVVWWWTPYFGSDTNFLYYVQWKNERWSKPVMLSDNSLAPTMCIDEMGILHLAWMVDIYHSKIYYTQAKIESSSPIPESYKLYQNYPNPFKKKTTISYWMPVRKEVRIKVYDLQGNEIKCLVDSVCSSGTHKVYFDASHLPNGVYFYQLEVGSYRKIKKMLVLR